MNLLITGASGFLGREVVKQARARGHSVLAQSFSQTGDGFIQADLRTSGSLDGHLTDIDAVIHLAAALSGDEASHQAITVQGTVSLLASLKKAGTGRLIHASSFSVYDYRALPENGVLDEQSPLEARPHDRDAYTRAKLQQEALLQGFDGSLTILRPAMIYDEKHAWNGHMGLGAGPLWLSVSPQALMPVVRVENVALAFVLAAETGVAGIFNLIDDALPTRADYFRNLSSKPMLPVSWRLINAAGWLADRSPLKGKLPSFLSEGRGQARFKPLRYSNAAVKAALGWRPV
jgi:nucleoside-diphosphate-sugar epimerase